MDFYISRGNRAHSGNLIAGILDKESENTEEPPRRRTAYIFYGRGNWN